MSTSIDPTEPLRPLRSSASLADLAYERIRSAILSGSLAPGDRLSVPALARQLEVSRSPVREALVRIERDGLATSSQHKGAVVAQPGSNELFRLYEVREVLEGLVARLVAQGATSDDLADLDARLTRHREVVEQQAATEGSIDAHVGADLEFHRRLLEAAGEHPVTDLLGALADRISLARFSTATQTGDPELAVRQHAEILAAIEDGDPDRAEELARAHVRDVRDRYASALGSRS